MKYLNDYTNEPISEMMKKHGAFFAFGMSQFEEAKDPNIPQAEYTHIIMGMYAPAVNAKAILEEYTQICKDGIAQDIAENGYHNIILRELNNHECFYTGDHEDAWSSLQAYPGLTEKMVLDVFKNKTNPQYEQSPA
ncbi:MAG: hypothetical protein KBB46_03065 [Candidatus Pacebacteria bacterium]|nr:hypothetical protein [Candidatus Paceibacterota bacterium]